MFSSLDSSAAIVAGTAVKLECYDYVVISGGRRCYFLIVILKSTCKLYFIYKNILFKLVLGINLNGNSTHRLFYMNVGRHRHFTFFIGETVQNMTVNK